MFTMRDLIQILKEKGLKPTDFNHIQPREVYSNSRYDVVKVNDLIRIGNFKVAQNIELPGSNEIDYQLYMIQENCNKGLKIKLLSNHLNSGNTRIEFRGRYNIIDDLYVIEGYEWDCDDEYLPSQVMTFSYASNNITDVINEVVKRYGLLDLETQWIESIPDK